jgi:hypothetical protein
MGYTHYFEQKKTWTKKQWDQIKEGVSKILEQNYAPLEDVKVSDDLISFNGVEDDGHETFFLQNSPKFRFCKTARKPYDKAVCLAILHVKSVAPKSIRISSDGDWDDEWVPIREEYKKLFQKEPPELG